MAHVTTKVANTLMAMTIATSEFESETYAKFRRSTTFIRHYNNDSTNINIGKTKTYSRCGILIVQTATQLHRTQFVQTLANSPVYNL